MRLRYFQVFCVTCLLLGGVCFPAMADFGIDFSPLHSPNFGKRPSYRFEQGNDGLLHPTSVPAPAPHDAPSPQQNAAQQAAHNWFSQGVTAMNARQWDAAVHCFSRALEFSDEKEIRQGLLSAQAFMAYEQRLREEQEQKGRALVNMSDCLTVLSEALADIKSSVAGDSIARSVQAGEAPSTATGGVLADASVVDLRHVTLGMVEVEKLQSPYARMPEPIYAAGQVKLTDKQMTKMANLFLGYEMGFSPSERDIEEMLDLPVVEHTNGTPAADSRVSGAEHKQIHAALERFSTALVKGCNEALYHTSQRLNNDPLVRNARTLAATDGWEHVDPAIKALLAQRDREAHAQLFAQFRIVQDQAMQQLGFECTTIFQMARGMNGGKK